MRKVEILNSYFFQAIFWKSLSHSLYAFELNGFSSLPDILWHPETRKFIEADLALGRQFKKATSSRCAKKAYEGFVSIAAVILSTELLEVGRIGRLGGVPPGGK